MGRRWLAVCATSAALASLCVAVACGSFHAAPDTNVADGAAADDGATGDETSLDGGASPDAASYGDITDSSRWSVFDLAAQLDTSLTSFTGAVFDGRYLNLVPFQANHAVRFDTIQGSFAVGPWWNVVNMGGAGEWYGGVWDGRLVYFLPHTASPANNLVAFFPDKFSPISAWANYGLGMGSYGPAGGAFDGRFVYMVPYTTTTITRFDTDGGLNAYTPFETADIGQLGGNSCVGAAFDGRYVYFAPATAATNELTFRFDTKQPKLVQSALESFDLGELAIDPAQGFAGAVFDGRYVYLVPSFTVGVAAASVVTRFDTTLPFTQKGAWSTHSIAPAGEFTGGTFDGRYVYFAPSAIVSGSGQAVVARYDTASGAFSDQNAWSFFDLAKLLGDAGANTSYRGAAFDGRYVYLIPNQSGLLVRFDARSPRGMPVFDGGGAGSFL
jgi:hypothetical protein